MEKWKTSITRVEQNKLTIRGQPLDGLIGEHSFSDVIYLIIKGTMPTKRASRLLDAILVSSIDHGVTPPSTQAARVVASTGASFNAALAAGVLAINRHHGGAIEGCMQLLQEVVSQSEKEGISIPEAAAERVTRAREEKKKLPGYGHRIHSDDPRTAKLYNLAKETGYHGQYVQVALLLQEEIQRITGRSLPINVDGAIASLLCELGFNATLANAFFIIARLPGLTAHVFEEVTTQKPMRRINPADHVYEA